MKIIESETVGTPTRRVVLELPEDRAKALSLFISEGITWDATPVEDELDTLHTAFGGHVR